MTSENVPDEAVSKMQTSTMPASAGSSPQIQDTVMTDDKTIPIAEPVPKSEIRKQSEAELVSSNSAPISTTSPLQNLSRLPISASKVINFTNQSHPRSPNEAKTAPLASTTIQPHINDVETSSLSTKFNQIGNSIGVKSPPHSTLMQTPAKDTVSSSALNASSRNAPPVIDNKFIASAGNTASSSANTKMFPASSYTNPAIATAAVNPSGLKNYPAIPPKPIPSTLLGYRSAASGAPILIGGVSTPLPQYTIASVPGIALTSNQTTTIQKSASPISHISPTMPAKVEYRSTTGVSNIESAKGDETMKDTNDEAENERTRLENRERKKRWREANEDRNKDNDLRCRVNKRAHKLYGKEPSRAKDLWIEEEFNKRKSKRQEKEGKGPDGNLLIEGTDLSSLNHYEMKNVLMTTIAEFVVNPAAPTLKDNFDLTTMLNNLKTEPGSLEKLFSGDPGVRALQRNSCRSSAVSEDTGDRVGGGQGSSDDEEEEKESGLQPGAISNSQSNSTDFLHNLSSESIQNMPKLGDPGVNTAQRPSVASNTSGAVEQSTQHQTYGIGSGFESQMALALSSELFRLISMQPTGSSQTGGISQTTKSPVLNGDPGLAPNTRPAATFKSEPGTTINV